MASNTPSVAASRSLSIETLESRLNLSTLTGLALPLSPEGTPWTRMVGTHRTTTSAAASLKHSVAGATGSSMITLGRDTWIDPGSYTAIAHAKLETRHFGEDIGYVSRSGAYVEYTVNVAMAGNYTLNVGVASVEDASFSVSSNGVTLATFSPKSTGSWDAIDYVAQTVSLSAGTQTLRFTALNKSQYNLNSFELRIQGKPATVAVAPVTTTPVALTPSAVSVDQRWMNSFTELDITGITSNSSIYVAQSGNTFTITTGNQTQQVTGDFGTLVVSAGGGDAAITVDSSVMLPTTVYSGTGDDTILNATRGQAVIVTLDGGSNTVTGNGINTAFWVAPSDTVNATAAETANGGVHVIASMYQPTNLPKGSAAVTSVRDGMKIADPAASTNTTTRLPSSSFFGTGPVVNDVIQGQSSDCYYLATLTSLAHTDPGKLEQLGVDLGDGTYVIAFQRNGQKQYVRVDGDLPSGGPYVNGLEYAHPGASGDQWAPIFEKAYAYYRTGASSYASLDWGFTKAVYTDFGINANMVALPANQNAFYTSVSSSLAAAKGVEVMTNNVIANGAPLVQAHSYSVMGVSKDSSGTVWLTLRNPWGFDGFNADSNGSDGLITISYATLKANAYYANLVS